jgi:hypothetical protein
MWFFLSPSFVCLALHADQSQASTRIVSWFELFIVNVPGSVMEGRLTTPGRVEYLYKCFSACSILFIEVKLELGTATERLDAIAQVIAESDSQCRGLTM